MTEGKLTIDIAEDITEEGFMEHCLNLRSSGFDPMIALGIFALGKRWHIDKVTFMLRELAYLDKTQKEVQS